VRVAVVGTGSAGRRHLGTLAELGITELIAVNEHRPGPPLAVDGASVTTVHDFDDALAATPDAVIIANPTALHADYTQRAVLAGIPVLCEKPLALDAVQAAHVRAVADDRGVIVGVCSQFRFHEHLIELRERLNGGSLGRVVDVVATQGEHLADYHPDEDYRRSYAARAALGGGVMLTQVHLFDVVDWLVGPFVRVFAVGGRRTDLELDVEDSVSFLLEGRSGVAVRGHLDYFRRPRRFTLEVTGTQGNAAWDYYESVLSFTGSRAYSSARPFDRPALFRATVADFVEATRDGRRPRTSADDAVAVLELVDAARRALASGVVEPIPLNREAP
jgi:predicted dehydrogenase